MRELALCVRDLIDLRQKTEGPYLWSHRAVAKRPEWCRPRASIGRRFWLWLLVWDTVDPGHENSGGCGWHSQLFSVLCWFCWYNSEKPGYGEGGYVPLSQRVPWTIRGQCEKHAKHGRREAACVTILVYLTFCFQAHRIMTTPFLLDTEWHSVVQRKQSHYPLISWWMFVLLILWDYHEWWVLLVFVWV